MAEYFSLLDRLVGMSAVVVDRPRGSAHPRYPEVSYPLDYGHLADTTSDDGAEVDVFVGSADGRGVVGVLLTADLGKRDVEIKILIDCTAAEVQVAQQFCAGVLEIGGYLIRRPLPT